MLPLFLAILAMLLQEVPLNGESTITVQLTPAYGSTNEVIVTALGIRKETKKIGYAVQEVKGEDLIKARDQNPIPD